MDHLLVVNGSAGSSDEDAVAAAAEVLREVGDVEVVATDDPDDLDDVLTGAGGRRVVICGGDGSIHLAVARLDALDLLSAPRARGDRGDVPLGLVPLGTGNDLARGLGLPLDDPAAAAIRVRDGRPRPLDLLRADDGAVAVNALHAGVGAQASARADDLKDQLAAAAYPVGALLAGVAADGVRTEVAVDGRVLVDDDVLMVAVCNGGCFGGGATMAPHARPDDGRLDVVVTTAVGPVARAAFGLAFARGDHLERDDVHVATGTEVTVRSHGETALEWNVDGELPGAATTRTWRVEPGAWRLVR